MYFGIFLPWEASFRHTRTKRNQTQYFNIIAFLFQQTDYTTNYTDYTTDYTTEHWSMSDCAAYRKTAATDRQESTFSPVLQHRSGSTWPRPRRGSSGNLLHWRWNEKWRWRIAPFNIRDQSDADNIEFRMFYYKEQHCPQNTAKTSLSSSVSLCIITIYSMGVHKNTGKERCYHERHFPQRLP